VWGVVCGVWCVVCGVWCVVCGVWCVVCGVWCVVCGVVWYGMVWCEPSGVYLRIARELHHHNFFKGKAARSIRTLSPLFDYLLCIQGIKRNLICV
jgi:hypothetical protein